MTIIEFLIPNRPLSLQTRSRSKLQAWKRLVTREASLVWGSRPAIRLGDLHVALVHLYRAGPLDADNIIKPIQDALIGVVMEDDRLVADVESHRRALTQSFEISRLPMLLRHALLVGDECVYVRVSNTEPLEDLL